MGCMQSKPALVSGLSSNARGQEQICAESSPRGVGFIVESSDATDLLKLKAAIEAGNWQSVGDAAQKKSDSTRNVGDLSRNELPDYVPFSVPFATYSPGGMSLACGGGGGAVGGCGGCGGGGGCGG
jgi:hypothetical protein